MYICVYTHICQKCIYTDIYNSAVHDYICRLCQNGAGVVHLESVLNHHKKVSKRLKSLEMVLCVLQITGFTLQQNASHSDSREELTCQASGDINPDIVRLLTQTLTLRFCLHAIYVILNHLWRTVVLVERQ